MAFFTCRGPARAGSNVAFTVFFSRSTSTPPTQGTLETDFFIAITQCMQLMPSTLNTLSILNHLPCGSAGNTTLSRLFFATLDRKNLLRGRLAAGGVTPW